jgi:hypothetical protein
VALVRTDVSEELSASFIRVTKTSELETKLAVTSIVSISPILVTLMKEALRSSGTSVLKRATLRNIPEDAILHNHHRENFKSANCSVSYLSLRNISGVRDQHWAYMVLQTVLLTASVV